MLKLHLLYEHDLPGRPYGCFFIRLLRPLSHPTVRNEASLSYGLDLPRTSVDAVIVERGWRPDITLQAAQRLVKTIRERGEKFIYTLDDNLVDLNSQAPWETFPSDEQRMVFRYFIRQADGVIVSTENLRNRFSVLNSNVFVVPNALDEDLFVSAEHSPVKKADEPTRIGYMGTRTHTADLMMIMPALRDFLRKNDGKVVLELVGVYSDPRIEQCFKGYPVRFLDVGSAVDYEKFVPWAVKNLHWDFALAPLEDNLFNRSKSDIKFLDYSMLGIPGIYSDVDSYRDSITHRETGWLCKNQFDAWFEALDVLFKDHQLRQSIGKSASAFVRESRTLQYRAVDWIGCIKQILVL